MLVRQVCLVDTRIRAGDSHTRLPTTSVATQECRVEVRGSQREENGRSLCGTGLRSFAALGTEAGHGAWGAWGKRSHVGPCGRASIKDVGEAWHAKPLKVAPSTVTFWHSSPTALCLFFFFPYIEEPSLARPPPMSPSGGELH